MEKVIFKQVNNSLAGKLDKSTPMGKMSDEMINN